MKKINILHPGSKLKWSYYFGYWSVLNYFKNEIEESGYQISFFNKITKEFFDADFIFLVSRYFTDSIQIKLRKKLKMNYEFNLKEKIETMSVKNPNIIWFDLGDSAGTTSFEIMPYIKKYAKNQVYVDKFNYKKLFFRNRYYADYYQKKYDLEKQVPFHYTKLHEKYESKLVQSWNIGVGNYYDIINNNKIKKNLLSLKGFFFNYDKKDFKYRLKFREAGERYEDFFLKQNLRSESKKKSIFFQRYFVTDFLRKKYSLDNVEKRINHKNYLEKLNKAKISVGSFGWGEICYREFEATFMGACIIYPNISYIKTWPNIYINNQTCLTYDLNFENLEEKINKVLINDKLRKELVYNAQKVLDNVLKEDGLTYMLNFLSNVTK